MREGPSSNLIGNSPKMCWLKSEESPRASVASTRTSNLPLLPTQPQDGQIDKIAALDQKKNLHENPTFGLNHGVMVLLLTAPLFCPRTRRHNLILLSKPDLNQPNHNLKPQTLRPIFCVHLALASGFCVHLALASGPRCPPAWGGASPLRPHPRAHLTPGRSKSAS